MTLSDYRQHYADLFNKIQTAQSNLDDYLYETRDSFSRLYKKQQEIDKRWFVAHLDYILRHKDEFTQSEQLNNIVIDFLLPYRSAGMVAGFAWNSSEEYKIYLKDLINLWDSGFCYEGNPIISYQVICHYGRKIILEYVQNGRIKQITKEYKNGSNPLELSKELISQVNAYDISDQYPDWKIYKRIDLIRNALEKRYGN